MEFQFSPHKDEDPKDAEAESDELGGEESLTQPDGGDDGAENGDAGVHERGEPGAQGKTCPTQEDEGDG